MDAKRAASEVGPRDYLRGYGDGVKRIVEHLLGKEGIARRGLAPLRAPDAAAVPTISAEEYEVSLAPPSELLVVVGDAYVPRIGEVISRLEKAGLEVGKGSVDVAARTIFGLAPRQGLPDRIKSMKRIEGVKDVEEMLCLSLVVDDEHLSSTDLDDVVARAKRAGLRLKSRNAAIGIIIGTAGRGSLEPLRRIVGVDRVEKINC
jgi:hypothetical protein